jgi:hypothetical protein
MKSQIFIAIGVAIVA